MKKTTKKDFCVTACLLLLFVLWTAVVCLVDVQEIGPNGSKVGFATMNGVFHDLTGVHMLLYTITDWLGLVPLCFVLGFGLLGFKQLVTRRSLFQVDADILVLGGFYVLVMAAYLLFEMFPINFRPILIEGVLEASYPSSTTLLVMCVMPTAIMQFRSRIQNKAIKNGVTYVIIGFTAFMVIGRLVSGVHWLTDILGGALLSVGLVSLYRAICNCMKTL